MRLIDVDAIRIKPQYLYVIDGMVMIRAEDIARILEEQPTVKSEVKKGHWIEGMIFLPTCSECGGKAYGLHAFDCVKSDFCPNCGADMRGEQE